MHFLTADQVPPEHPYYRSSSPAYRAYLHRCGLKTVDAPGGFGWIKKLLHPLYLAKFERTPGVPDIADLKAKGFKKGWVIWIPAHTATIPKGWRKMWFKTHLSSSGFTIIDSPDYATKWNQRARRARKKFLASEARIVSMAPADFMAAFRATRVRHLCKSDYITYFRKLTELDAASVRSWGVEWNGKIVAGLAVHDYAGNSSAHLVAFTSREARPLQAGTGLIDRWFSDSLARGIKYINFDHLRDAGMTRDQQGYTDFKNNFIEYAVKYRHSYFRWVG